MGTELEESRAQRAAQTNTEVGLVKQREDLMNLHTAIAKESGQLSDEQAMRGALREAAGSRVNETMHRVAAQKYAKKAGLPTDAGHARQIAEKTKTVEKLVKRAITEDERSPVKVKNEVGEGQKFEKYYPTGR